MNNHPIQILGWVAADLRQAAEFYASWRTDGASVFIEKYRDALRLIELNPELFPLKYGHFRRAPLHRSYFSIFYAIETHRTLIVAVIDTRRNPQTIRSMLNQRWRNENEE